MYLGMACLAAIGAVFLGAILSSRNVQLVSNPEDVHVADGVFVSDYFGLQISRA